jgi:hypothetical protein
MRTWLIIYLTFSLESFVVALPCNFDFISCLFIKHAHFITFGEVFYNPDSPSARTTIQISKDRIKMQYQRQPDLMCPSLLLLKHHHRPHLPWYHLRQDPLTTPCQASKIRTRYSSSSRPTTSLFSLHPILHIHP